MKIKVMRAHGEKTMIEKCGNEYSSDFRYSWMEFEYDKDTNRYYYLDESRALNSQVAREGGLVRRRMAKDVYQAIRALAIKEVEEYATFLEG